ncbi:MAG: hypothetical protein ACXW6T_15760, partial [Candidatus Binatia bacterium]
RTISIYRMENLPAWFDPPINIVCRIAPVVTMPCSDATVSWRTTQPAKRLLQVKPRRIANPVVDQFSGSRRKNLASPIVWPRPFFGEDDVHDQGQEDDQYQEKQFAFVCHNYLRFKTAGINTAAQFSRKLDASRV